MCSNTAVVRLKLKWKMSKRCNTAPCARQLSVAEEQELPRLRGNTARGDVRLDEELEGWSNVGEAEARALLDAEQLARVRAMVAGAEVQWQRHPGM